jgi:hypothetical protein
MIEANNYIPLLSIHPTELYLYGERIEPITKTHNNNNSLKNLLNNNHHNTLSDTAKRKAKRAINYLLYQSKTKKAYNYKTKSMFEFKVNFITLTLPSRQIHTDQLIKKECLNQFLIEAKKKWNLTNYVWKSERQANGNIHFHILSDVFIPWLEMRNTWNRIVNKLGYVDRFTETNHKNNPNSTDIHSLKKVHNIKEYILKYMIKKNKTHNSTAKRKLHPQQYPNLYQKNNLSNGVKKFLSKTSNNGRIWSCSYELSNLTGGRSEINDEISKEIDQLKKDTKTKTVQKDYWTGVFYVQEKLQEKKYPYLYSLLSKYCEEKFNSRAATYILNL